MNVPAPQRYAIHKLIVSRRRAEGAAKRDKDVQRAEALLAALVKKRPHELKAAWHEAYERGKEWRKLLQEGASQLSAPLQEAFMHLIGRIPEIS